MTFIQKLFTSRTNGADGSTYIGEEDRIWWDPVRNGFYRGDGHTPGGILIGTGGGGGPSVNLVVSDVPPTNPTEGLIWFDTTTGIEYQYINDGNSSQWVAIAVPSNNGQQGTSGFSGQQGLSGFSGKDGVIGVDGLSGFSGAQGLSGFSGAQGTSGFSGLNGTIGVDGLSGFSGAQGIAGTSGFSGLNGTIGVDGLSGFSGQQGTSGFSGKDGSAGPFRYAEPVMIGGMILTTVVGDIVMEIIG